MTFLRTVSNPRSTFSILADRILMIVVIGLIAWLAFAITEYRNDEIQHNAKQIMAIKATQARQASQDIKLRIAVADNKATLIRLCGAAQALAQFWREVRASTAKTLLDSTLSHASRVANIAFVKSLTDAIKEADRVGDCGVKP